MGLIIVLSDIHGNLPALEAAWKDASARPYAACFCLGDLAAFGPWPDECVAFVRDVVKPTAAIRGNTDRYLVDETWGETKADERTPLQRSLERCRGALSTESLAYLGELPASHTTEIDGVDIKLVHGAPGDDEFKVDRNADRAELEKLFGERGAGLSFCGHTHVPYRTNVGARQVINVGSIGFPFDGDHRACYVRATIAGGRLNDFENRRVAYNVDRVVTSLQEGGDPYAETLVRRLRFAEI